MSKFQNCSIYEAVENTISKEYLLPVFQRSFVWKEEDIEKLFDSVMQEYPISSMLFWKLKVDKEDFTHIKFYEFLNRVIEYYKIENTEACPTNKDFIAVLDGQQRLTAFRIGLTGSYASHIRNKRWINTKENFSEKKLYFCLSSINKTGQFKYIFKFKTEDQTNGWQDLHVTDSKEVWFKVGKIYECHYKQNNETLFNFRKKNEKILSEEMEEKLYKLDEVLSNTDTINYYLESTQSSQIAVEIFNRVNSGGKKLDSTDILFSILVANTKKDFRDEFDSVLKISSNMGIPLRKSFILKSLLYLFHKSVKTSTESFTEEFCKTVECNWDRIRKSLFQLVNLIKNYGFIEESLTSYNALLPIYYYIFHKNLNNDFANAVGYEQERKIIKKWLICVLLRHAFGGSSDTTLHNARQAFFPDFENKIYIQDNCNEFPALKIEQQIHNDMDALDEEFFENILNTQKDHKDSFLILSLLFKDLDYKNGNFHKDHMHPVDSFQNLPPELKEKYQFSQYNSIVNLQFLDANENESKKNKTLKNWVEIEVSDNEENKKIFFDKHYIPNVELELNNFEQFYIARKQKLKEKLEEELK